MNINYNTRPIDETSDSIRILSNLVEVSIVIPVHNSENQLPELLTRLTKVLVELECNYEVIFIEDGSQDNSWGVLLELQKAHPTTVSAIQLMRNFGQHNAIMCGFREASGNYIITLDDDLQNPPEEIPKLIQKIKQDDLDLVYGCYENKKHHPMRNIGSNLSQWFYRKAFNLENGVSAFRIIRSQLVECVSTYNRNFTYLDGLFAWNTTRIAEISVQHHQRHTGKSGYTTRRLIQLAMNLFTNFTLIPLQIVSGIGVIMAILGFTAGLYYGYARVVNNIEVPGFASMMIAIVSFSGIQLLSIGVIGEYLGRLHINSNSKPQYVKRTTVGRQTGITGFNDSSSSQSDEGN